MTTRPCPNCRSDSRDDARYCARCGQPLPAVADATRYETHTPDGINFHPHTTRSRSGFSLPHQERSVPPDPPWHSPTMVDVRHPLGSGDPNQREHTFLCMDGSASMKDRMADRTRRVEAACEAASAYVQGKHHRDPRDQVGVIAFASSAKLLYPLTCLATGVAALEQTIRGMKTGGGTNMTAALENAERSFDWADPNIVRRIVLWSDGQNNQGDPLPVAARLKDRNVVIEAMGIGDREDVDEDMLREIATGSGDRCRYWHFRDARSFTTHVTMLSDKTSVDY